VTFALQISRRAEADIDTHVGSIARRTSPISAARWHIGIRAKIRMLVDLPELWPLADEATELGLELREALYGRRRHVYRILYTFDGQTVHIHRVRHAAQDRLSTEDV
jgi:plasmid stabilization system protein ParE